MERVLFEHDCEGSAAEYDSDDGYPVSNSVLIAMKADSLVAL